MVKVFNFRLNWNLLVLHIHKLGALVAKLSILVHFKERQTKPEGQIRFRPCDFENMSETSLDLEGEWEVVNDDGFVYKRRKGKEVPASSILIKTTTSKCNDDQYVKQRRQTKKVALLNLKEKYAKEIRDWESLSQMLQKTPAYSIPSLKEHAPSLDLPQTQTGNRCKYILKELSQQVEVQEAFIQDAKILCNLAEMMCDAHEQVLKQSIFDLPVWGPATTPIHNLLSSNSEDDI